MKIDEKYLPSIGFVYLILNVVIIIIAFSCLLFFPKDIYKTVFKREPYIPEVPVVNNYYYSEYKKQVAEEYYENKDYKNALETIKKSLELNPTNIDAIEFRITNLSEYESDKDNLAEFFNYLFYNGRLDEKELFHLINLTLDNSMEKENFLKKLDKELIESYKKYREGANIK